MANNCFVRIEITAFTAKDAGRFCRKLNAAKKAADVNLEGVYIGCRGRYLFDAKIERNGDKIFIRGWVKWGFADAEVWMFLLWLMKEAGVKDLRMGYNEGGCLLYGEYHYDGQTLTDRYLPQEYFPSNEGDDVDTEKAFSEYGVTRIIG